jgi:hypothetical protein
MYSLHNYQKSLLEISHISKYLWSKFYALYNYGSPFRDSPKPLTSAFNFAPRVKMWHPGLKLALGVNFVP